MCVCPVCQSMAKGLHISAFIRRSLMEEHVAELETLLDAELVDALDDTIGEKIEDNHREKTR